jgi:excisionase family DNA binding protein
MSYQAPHQATAGMNGSHPTVDELLADPARAKGLSLEAVPELLAEIALRTAPLKTLEGTLLGLLAQGPANGGNGIGNSGLLSAPQLAELWNIPESWVREQARMGNLPSIRLGHYVRFRTKEVERFLAERANQGA